MKELEELNRSCPTEFHLCEAKTFAIMLKKVITIFEIYVRTTLHAVRKEEYEDILHTASLSLENRPYYEAIYMWQVVRYSDYQKSGRSYSIRDSIQNILEYEI